MPARIIIGGDVVPTESNKKLFAEANVDELIGIDLKGLLHSADYTIFNLEVPLVDKEDPIQKCGPNLIAPTETINGLKVINPHFFTLANNHILDQGEQGLYSTMDILDKSEIGYAGVGKNLDEASKSFVKEINGIKIGIYCCAEHEFSIATENTAGANPFDPLESLDHISILKTESDYVIVLYHGGKEHYRYPSPYLQRVCRKIVDKGADLVVCQHSHCIGCEEKWNGGTIVYGQGNFLFDHSESEYWQTSLLVDLTINGNDADVSYIPLVKAGCKVRAAEEKQKKKIIEGFRERSLIIESPGTVEKIYQEFAVGMLNEYLGAFAGRSVKGFWFRAFNKLSGQRLRKWCFTRRYQKIERIALQNFVECEAHRELVVEGLKSSVIRKEDL